MTKKEIQIVQDFVRKNDLGVLSTLGGRSGILGSAVYYFTDTDFNFYFVTKERTQKYKNITKNSKVAFTVVNKRQLTTLQMSGTAKLFSANDKVYFPLMKKIIKLITSSDKSLEPPIQKIKRGEYMIIKVKPGWCRYMDYSGKKALSIDVV